MDETEKKQIKEHIRTLEYVRDELISQQDQLTDRIFILDSRIIEERNKLKND